MNLVKKKEFCLSLDSTILVVAIILEKFKPDVLYEFQFQLPKKVRNSDKNT